MERDSSVRPQISIIVPVYDVEKYLPKCIDSLLAQTLTDIEIILVDDGSPDECGKICDAYALKDPRIKVLHIQNVGVSAARNCGLAAASADVIGFVDSDDWVDPHMYEYLLRALRSSGADIAICNVSYDYVGHSTPGNHQIEEKRILSRDEALRVLVEDRTLRSYPWDKIFKKSILRSGFPENARFEDLIVMVDWFASADKVVMMPFDGYHYTQRSGSYLHSNAPIRAIDYINALQLQLRFLKSHHLIPDIWDFCASRIVKQGIIQAKNLAREMPWAPQLIDNLREIIQLIKPYADKALPDLGPKYRRRYRLLSRRPRQFVLSMKLQGFFHFSGKISRRKHFE